MLNARELNAPQFLLDSVHPTEYGHQLIADARLPLIEQ